MRFTARRVVLSIVLLSLTAGVAFGHISDTSWLMSRMARTREKMGVQRLKVQLKCGLDKDEGKPEILYLKVPGKVRREHTDGAIEVCSAGKCMLKRGDDEPVRQPEWVYLQYLYFVETNQSGERYVRLLSALKVDTKVDTLTRAGKRLAIVLGAKEWERDRPQFWLDKERYLPLRLMTRAGKTLVDIQWRDWGTRVAGDWFPAELEIRKDGKLVDRCVTEHVDVNEPMPDELFKLDWKEASNDDS